MGKGDFTVFVKQAKKRFYSYLNNFPLQSSHKCKLPKTKFQLSDTISAPISNEKQSKGCDLTNAVQS